MPKFSHPFIPNSSDEIKESMLKELNLESLDDLFKDLPADLVKDKIEGLPGPHSEYETFCHFREELSKNLSFFDLPSFLGGGVWPHWVPAAVKSIVMRSEFYTSYTSYQPEISQGMLQALFEAQSLICELLDMEVAVVSHYDWATSLAEAVLMSYRITRRREVIVPESINPDRLNVVKTYASPHGISVKTVRFDREIGQLDLADLESKVSQDTAAVYVENPSFLGVVEEGVFEIGQLAHEKDALFIVGVDPISLGLIVPPGKYDADIVVGEGQPLGNPMNYGGPLFGIMACKDRKDLIRQLPGRLIGMTTTIDGKERAFCMVLQTREQHIRRERATSNICTNEALCALAAAVYLSLLGSNGMKALCETIAYNSHYLAKKLAEIPGVISPRFKAPFFKEFVVTIEGGGKTVKELNDFLLENGIHGGIPLVDIFPDLGESELICVTEMHLKAHLDKLCSLVEKYMGGSHV